MITLRDLAEQLNISVSTVSKALNNSSEISAHTIERVKALAQHLNYQPNKIALSLKNSRTKTIGVLIPNILNHFFAKVLFGIEQEAGKFGYDIIICISNEQHEKELQSLEILGNGSVDGFILSLSAETEMKNDTEHIQRILNQNIPVVLFDRVSDNIACDKVVIDDFGAAYNATLHLFNEGRKKIVLVSNIEELSVGKLRTQGYLKALEDYKNYQQKPMQISIQQDEDAERVIDSFLNKNPNIDGILSIDNMTGVIALHKALALNMKVPKDISIIGFSDKNVLAYTTPKLSTISQHSQDIGATAVKTLVSKIQNPNAQQPTTKLIKTSLELRETTLS